MPEPGRPVAGRGWESCSRSPSTTLARQRARSGCGTRGRGPRPERGHDHAHVHVRPIDDTRNGQIPGAEEHYYYDRSTHSSRP
ncbi:HNH/endonuclease VII fold putative polymorphic toxin [Streptomyces sp. SDT5-1]|uniref:HNH/endonuclease VII fold putative polymorphic toxin n=1 Tax=Streptomyces sp. SDT5-1 TaxID=3406418 RepID=UPI003FD60F32